jgi:hypothetical protein
VKTLKVAMAMHKIDSFICKFKNLLLAEKKAHLDIQSKNGKAYLNLTAAVNVHPHYHVQSRNGQARQRHHEKRAAACEAAAPAATAAVKAAEENAVVKKNCQRHPN